MMMRAILLIFTLMFGFKVYSQQADSVKAVQDKKKPLYVVDGIVQESGIDGISPDSILRVDVLKEDKTSSLSHLRGDVVVVTTKSGAVYSYKKKFSGKSAAYAAYLLKNNNSDAGLTYVVNGQKVVDSDKISRLHNIDEKDITKVDFKSGKKPVLQITERAAGK